MTIREFLLIIMMYIIYIILGQTVSIRKCLPQVLQGQKAIGFLLVMVKKMKTITTVTTTIYK